MIHFISDLHLSPAEPATVDAFFDYLSGSGRACEAMWILGDLFEYWAGDDDLENPFNAGVADALRSVADNGITLRLIVGNRDFLLGKTFAQRAGLEIVEELQIIDLGGTRTALMHGDSLCTDDTPYMQFRQMVRNPAWQAQFLAQPLAVRRKIAEDMRTKSEMAKQEKDIGIMDVNAEAVARTFRDNRADILIHGHTHRPARHDLTIDGRDRQRWVLADWHGKAQWLEWDGTTLSRRSD